MVLIFFSLFIDIIQECTQSIQYLKKKSNDYGVHVSYSTKTPLILTNFYKL